MHFGTSLTPMLQWGTTTVGREGLPMRNSVQLWYSGTVMKVFFDLTGALGATR